MVGPPDYFFEKICGVAPLPLQPKNFAQNNSVLIQIANNTFLSVYPCSQDRIRTCMIEKTNFIRFFGMVNIFNVMSHGPTNQSPITRLPIPPPDYVNYFSLV